ncbi:hypothetical protein SAMN05216367_5934 [Tardiphaga sp. OK245]|nr:hypothetical protein SAMN05216367_5934 [Tardiphaga sp. OK245]
MSELSTTTVMTHLRKSSATRVDAAARQQVVYFYRQQANDCGSVCKPFAAITGCASVVAYSIYGTPHGQPEKVCYGTVQTLDQTASELRKLREAGVLDVYAIGFDPETANLRKPPSDPKSN